MEKLMNCELHIYIHDARRSYDVSIVKLDGIRIVEHVIAARCCLQPTTSRRNEQWKRKKKAESLNNSSKVKVVGCELTNCSSPTSTTKHLHQLTKTITDQMLTFRNRWTVTRACTSMRWRASNNTEIMLMHALLKSAVGREHAKKEMKVNYRESQDISMLEIISI